MLRIGGPAIGALILVAAGCGGGGQEIPADGELTLTGQVLARLENRYPVLGRDSVPEPRPTSGASTLPDGDTLLPPLAAMALTGTATFYADSFEGDRTASGIPFRQNQMVAAHRAFPFGTLLRVTNLANDRSVNVRVVDRGPFGGGPEASRPVIDLSRRAARQLGYEAAGRAQVRVEVLEWGEGLPQPS